MPRSLYARQPASCGIENFSFIVCELVQVDPDNSRAMSALTFLLFKVNTLQTKIIKVWVSGHCQFDSGVLNLHHGYNATIMTSKRLFRHNPMSRGTNQQSEIPNSYSVWNLNNKRRFILLWHSWLLHSLVVLAGPSLLQSSPPLEGGGLVHVLFRVWTPPPQVFEHTPYGIQSE